MPNILDIDPATLPQVPGAAVPARPRESMPPELARLLRKASAHTSLLGENEERWGQEAREQLFMQHPWLINYNVSEHVTASSPEGYATGFFRITPKHIPIATAGAETLSVITVPIVIRDFKLYPLDLFSIDGKSYPLTEERVAPILRLRDAFREVDREHIRSTLGKQVTPFTLGPLSGSEGLKFSEVVKRQRTQAAEALSEVPPLTADVFKMSSLSESAAERLEKLASVAGAELEAAEQGMRYRLAWASAPETGRRGVSQWFPVPLAKASAMFGESTTHDAIRLGRVVLNLNPDDPAALLAALPPAPPVERETLKVASVLEKASAAQPARLVRVVVSSERKEQAPRTIVGALVNEYVDSQMDRCCVGPMSEWTRGMVGVLSVEGDLSLIHNAWGNEVFLLEPPNGTEGAGGVLHPQRLSENLSSCTVELSPGPLAVVWQQGGVLYGMLLKDSTVEVDGVVYHPVARGANEGCLVSVGSGFQRAVTERNGNTTLLHVPEGAWLVGSHGVIQPGAPLTVISVPASTAVPEGMPPGAEALPDLDQKVAVAHDVDRWLVRSTVEHGIPCRTRDDARFALAACGVPAPLAEAAIKTAADTREQVEVRYRVPHFDVGAREVLPAVQAVRQKLASHREAFETHARQLQRIHAALVPLTERWKTSAMDGARAVDTVLSLGFLSRENLLRFVDMAPAFDKTLSYLCALLLASRLGLDEVDEDSVEASIRGLDSVLSSLRTVEYAITQR